MHFQNSMLVEFDSVRNNSKFSEPRIERESLLNSPRLRSFRQCLTTCTSSTQIVGHTREVIVDCGTQL